MISWILALAVILYYGHWAAFWWLVAIELVILLPLGLYAQRNGGLDDQVNLTR